MNSKSTAKIFQTVSSYDSNSNYPYSKFSALESYCNQVGKINFNVIISIWKTYFTFGYYVCVIPFKPIYDYETNRWILKTWKPQQVKDQK